MDQKIVARPLAGDPVAVRKAGAVKASLLTGTILCLLSISSVQFGAALSADIISAHGPFATSFLRLLLAAAILAAIVRPRILSYDARQWKNALFLGVAMAGMTTCFYASIERIPLGLAVAIEFLGPLAVASFGMGFGRKLFWPLAALAGVILLSHNGETWTGDTVGVLLAAGAGVGWGCYILLMKGAGKLFPGLEGLAMSLAVAAVVCAPLGLVRAPEMMAPDTLALMTGLAILVPLVPYALEMIALRHLPTSAFGILMSLEPAVGAIAGFMVLGQVMTPLQMLGTGFVVAASAGVTAAAE
ncbi:EamA family transporter [Sinorhizobium sp. BG8]|uniref:EamA family transporter n=1 Tax=Sinorhizobium sp. BG8 TaxID=2613773 RepID=UPI00193CE12F|nr:EamA family transporter [Sinorhizobium sp. BG8]QRM53904.1 EamA family transporter [Sinorhizobium sp. BG8]